MSAETDVMSLLGRYCRAMDGEDVEALLDCYTADGVFRYYEVGESDPVLDLRGHDELVRWFAEHRDQTRIGSQTHVTVNLAVSIDGTTADASSTYIAVRESAGGGIAITATGTYADRVVREQDGGWRFAERICRAFMPH